MAIKGLIVRDDTRNWHNHGFKMWVDQVVNKHFSPDIASRFYGTLEVEKYNKKNKNIVKQLHDEKYVMEVYYVQPNGIQVFICDLFSGWPKEAVEVTLLRYITDKVKTNQIGKDWGAEKGKISLALLAGRYDTGEVVTTD